jgi:hypothetical protein
LITVFYSYNTYYKDMIEKSDRILISILKALIAIFRRRFK